MKDTSDGQDCHISDGDETRTVMHGYCRTRPETVGSPDAARNRSLVPWLRKAGSKLWEHDREMQCFDVWSESSLCTCRRDNTTYSLFTAERFRQNLLHVLWKWSENKGFAFFFHGTSVQLSQWILVHDLVVRLEGKAWPASASRL